MNLRQEWKIIVNTAKRRMRAGSMRIEDEAIIAMDGLIEDIIQEAKRQDVDVVGLIAKREREGG